MTKARREQWRRRPCRRAEAPTPTIDRVSRKMPDQGLGITLMAAELMQ